MLKYGVVFHDIVYPKWAKVRFKISAKGKLLIIINPSLTPGKLPEGLKPGMIPKGTKVFDYDDNKECILSLSLAECLKIIDFAKNQNSAETVDIIHRQYGDTKTLAFGWSTTNNGEISICNINYYKKSPDGTEYKTFIPVPYAGLREIVTILNSYVNNYVFVKTFCISESEQFEGSNESRGSKYKRADELPDAGE